MSELREVDPANHRDVAWAAHLHLELFRSMGPVAQLGELFVRQFCYSVLLRDGLMRAAIYEVDGKPAGLIAYTARSITFHRSALRRHVGQVVWLVAHSLARDPKLVLRMPKALRLMTSRRGEQRAGADPMAEVLAIGVLPEFRSPEFVRASGLRIGDELLAHAVAYFRDEGFTQLRTIVDADNKPAVLFYRRMGARVEPYEQGGIPSVQVWLDLAPRVPHPPPVPSTITV